MTVIKSTACRSSYGRLSYIFSGVAHNQQRTHERVLACSGTNIRLLHDPSGNVTNHQSGAYLERQFHQSLQRAKNPHRRYQAQSLVISFSETEFDGENLNKDAAQALKLVQSFADKYFGDAQSVCAIQGDGNGGKIHAHLLINTVKTNGKTIQTNRFSVFKLRKDLDKFMAANFQKVTGRQWTKATHLKRQDAQSLATKSSWQKHVKSVIDTLKQEVTSATDFIKALASQGITVTERNKGTRWTYHQQVQTSKGIKEYSVRDFYQRQNKKTGAVISTRGLGKDYTKESIESYFKQKSNRQGDIIYGNSKQRQQESTTNSYEEISKQARFANLQLEQQQRAQRRIIAQLNARSCRSEEDAEEHRQHQQQAQRLSDEKRRRTIIQQARLNDKRIPSPKSARGTEKSTTSRVNKLEGPSL